MVILLVAVEGGIYFFRFIPPALLKVDQRSKTEVAEWPLTARNPAVGSSHLKGRKSTPISAVRRSRREGQLGVEMG
jgi:hypothetical protein